MVHRSPARRERAAAGAAGADGAAADEAGVELDTLFNSSSSGSDKDK